MSISTSIQCFRASAAAVAWFNIIFGGVVFSGLLNAKMILPLDSNYQLNDSLVDILVGNVCQVLVVWLAACSNKGLSFSVAYHALFTLFCSIKWVVVLSSPQPKLSSQSSMLVFVYVSFVTFLQLMLSITVYKSIARKSNTATSKSGATNTGINTPLVGSESKTMESIMKDDPSEEEPDVPELMTNNVLAIACLPLKVGFYVYYMVLMLPLGLLFSSFRACYQRCTKGPASTILHLPSTLDKPMGGYACQMVFDKSFDIAKLREIAENISAECGIDKSLVRVDLEPEPPRGTWPKGSGPMDSNHYVGEGTGMAGQESWLKTMDILKMNPWSEGYNSVIWMRVWNSTVIGEPSVIHWRGPGQVWDGTSCFNFTKELIARYHGDAPKADLHQDGRLTLNEEVKKKLDQASFCRFLCWQQPTSICYNIHRIAWRFGGTIWPCCGGPGPDQVAAVLNLDKADSIIFASGAKELGMKPFAAMTWCVTTAHTKVVGSQVDRIIMQASMQSRCYEPKIATRHVIGDWLIGPVQRLNDGTVYTQERSQQEYNQLIKELSTFAPDSQVAQTFLAKAYGWKQKGASMFEMHPYYPHDIGIFGPSVFFNNYGIRSFHEKAGLVSWNWCAPYYLGCNSICVNGKNSIALASLVLGQEVLDMIRDQMWIEMKRIMKSNKKIN